MNTEKTIVEINGVKMEVDLRHATVVHQNLVVGSKVKLLEKNDYSGSVVYPGVIVGFEPFKDLPTIIVAYIKESYSQSELLFAYVNSSSEKKWDLVPSVDDELPVQKSNVLAKFDREIEKKENEVRELQARRDYFLRHFDAYFAPTA